MVVFISLVFWLFVNFVIMIICVSNMVFLFFINCLVFRVRVEVEERSLMCVSVSSVCFVGFLKVRLSF